MDDFGKSDGLPDPPTCLVTVYATVGSNIAPHLNYSVPIKGVVTKTKEIFVNRLYDPSSSSSQSMCLVSSLIFYIIIRLAVMYNNFHIKVY